MVNLFKRVRGAPEPGAPAPATGHSPRILFLTAFTIGFLRFEVHLSCSVRLLKRDSVLASLFSTVWDYIFASPEHNSDIQELVRRRKAIGIFNGEAIEGIPKRTRQRLKLGMPRVFGLQQSEFRLLWAVKR